ncbi:MAG TPA: AI-2E family transporter [Acetobacteraceae bacterium]|jgi:predicted PurR-regulated permease PerM|nr:AI-2E family transporter [Acetobacteraceae bacterium]
MDELAPAPTSEWTASAASIATTLRVSAIVTAAVLMIWLLSKVVLLIFFAVLLGVMLRGLADLLAKHTRLRPNLALAVVSLLLLAAFCGFAYYIGPRLVHESRELYTDLTHLLGTLRDRYGNTQWGQMLLGSLKPTPSINGKIAQSATSVVTSTLGGSVTVLVVVATALYFAVAPGLYVGGLVRLAPLHHRPRVRGVLEDIGQVLKGWLLGQSIDMIAVGVLTAIGLTLLGVPLPLALGVLAGVFTFVPYFGVIVAGIPAVLVGLTVSPRTALWVVLVFVICHGIEGYLISPFVQRRTVHLPPALTILSMTVMGAIFGGMGIVLGTPLAAVVLIAVRDIYVRETLGDTGV